MTNTPDDGGPASPVDRALMYADQSAIDAQKIANKLYSTYGWVLGPVTNSPLQILAAEVRRLQAEREWRPIESAPKDGTEIIACHYRYWPELTLPPMTSGPYTVAWNGKKWRSSWDGSKVVDYMSDFGTEYKEPELDPTHWQPMPSTAALAQADALIAASKENKDG